MRPQRHRTFVGFIRVTDNKPPSTLPRAKLPGDQAIGSNNPANEHPRILEAFAELRDYDIRKTADRQNGVAAALRYHITCLAVLQNFS